MDTCDGELLYLLNALYLSALSTVTCNGSQVGFENKSTLKMKKRVLTSKGSTLLQRTYS